MEWFLSLAEDTFLKGSRMPSTVAVELISSYPLTLVSGEKSMAAWRACSPRGVSTSPCHRTADSTTLWLESDFSNKKLPVTGSGVTPFCGSIGTTDESQNRVAQTKCKHKHQDCQALRNISDLDFGDRFLDQVMKGEKLDFIKSKNLYASVDIVKWVNANYRRGSCLQVIHSKVQTPEIYQKLTI